MPPAAVMEPFLRPSIAERFLEDGRLDELFRAELLRYK